MNIQDWLRAATPDEKEWLAVQCGTSLAYLYQLAGLHRLPSPVLAAAIEKATNGKVRVAEMRPDLARIFSKRRK